MLDFNRKIILYLHRSSWPRGQAVKTPPFHGGIMGSNPVGVTKKTPCLVFFYCPDGVCSANCAFGTDSNPSWLRHAHPCKQVRSPCHHGFLHTSQFLFKIEIIFL